MAHIYEVTGLRYHSDKSQIVMIGPAFDSLGGMASVAASYRDAGLFDRTSVRYLASYRQPSWRDKMIRLAQALSSLIVALLQHRVLLIHLHTAAYGSFWRKGLFVALGRLFDVPIVLHIHSGEFSQFYIKKCGRWRQSIVRWIMRNSDCVLCLTPTWQIALREIEPHANLQILPNPVVTTRFRGHQCEVGPVQPRCILFLGQLRKEKGIFDLLRAWSAVLREWPQASLVMAGDGNVEAVRTEANKLDITSSVILPGWVTGDVKQEWLNRADILVLPSYAEGLPMSVLEAMASGIAVVATRVGGIPDLIEHGVHGLLVEAGDIQALSAAILELMSNNTLRRQITMAAKERVNQEFEAGRVAASLESLWRGIVATHAQRKC